MPAAVVSSAVKKVRRISLFPQHPLLALTLFCILGVLVYVVPLWGAPNADLASNYIYLSYPPENADFWQAIPPYWQEVHYIPLGPVRGFFLEFYPRSERYNFLIYLYLWGMGRWAGSAADIWRLIPALVESLSIGLFYLMALRLKIARPLAILLAVSLFFVPGGFFSYTFSAEFFANLFLMMALYLALFYDGTKTAVISAAAVLSMALFKETYLSNYGLIAAAIVYRWAICHSGAGFRHFLRFFWRQITPHAVVLGLLLGFVLVVKSLLPVVASYSFDTTGLPVVTTAKYIDDYLSLLKPPLFDFSLFWMAVYAVVVLNAYFARVQTARLSYWALMAGLALSVVLHAAPYYLTGRYVEGRYIMPGNFLAALLIGVALQPLWDVVQHEAAALIPQRVKPLSDTWLWQAAWLILVAVLCFSPLEKMLHDAAQYRLDVSTWQRLKNDVLNQTPPNGHLVVNWHSASAGETIALQSELLISHRGDVTYHFGHFPGSECQRLPQSCAEFEAFNALQQPLPAGAVGEVIEVTVFPEGESAQIVPLPESRWEKLRLLLTSPSELIYRWYAAGKKTYMRYTINRR